MSRIKINDSLFRKMLCAVFCAGLAMLLLFSLAPGAHADMGSGTSGTCNWVVDDDGNMIISPKEGTSGTLAAGTQTWRTLPNKGNIKTIRFEGGTINAPANCSSMFAQLTGLESINFTNFNTSNIDKTYYMFENCNHLKTIDLSTWNMGNITDFSYMFSGCSRLETVNLKNSSGVFWAPKAYNFRLMFSGCSALEAIDMSPATIGGNASNGLDTYRMFQNCTSLQSADCFGDWSKFYDATEMFLNCTSLTSFDFSGKKPGSNERYMGIAKLENMFRGCTGLQEIDLSNFDVTNVYTMSGMFYGCTGIERVNLQNLAPKPRYLYPVSQTTANLSSMFYGCSNLTEIDLTVMDASRVSNMNSMFASSGLTSANLNGFTPGSVNCSCSCESMFANTKLSNVVMNVGESGISSMKNMFAYCNNLETVTITGITRTSNLVNMEGVFQNNYGGSKLQTVDLSNFDFSRAQTTKSMFKYCSKLETVKLGGWTAENCTDLSEMFYWCESLTNLSDTNISNWQTNKVKTMNSLFRNCSKLTAAEVGNWDTSNVTNMGSIFYNCSALALLDLRNWDTSKVTSGSSSFSGTNKLTTVAVGENTFNSSSLSEFSRGNSSREHWLQYATLGGQSIFNGEEVQGLVKNSTGIGWYKITGTTAPNEGDLYAEYVSEEAGQPLGWNKTGNVWSYTFNVFDDKIPYYIWENVVDGFNTEQDAAHPVLLDPANPDQIVSILNTKVQETGSLSITKIMNGNVDRSFTFNVHLEGQHISGAQSFSGVAFYNGNGTVTLSSGETVTLEKIPLGTSYSVTEDTPAGYSVSYTNASGIIDTADQTVEVMVENTPPDEPPPPDDPLFGGFSITKLLTGQYSKAGEYEFTVSLNGLYANFNYSYTISSGGGAVPFVSDEAGSAYVTFTLTKDEIATFTGLPKDSTYQISETGGNWSPSYTISSTGIVNMDRGYATLGQALNTEVETVDAGVYDTVVFTNELLKSQDLKVKKKIDLPEGENVTDRFEYTVVFQNLTPFAYYNSDIGPIQADDEGYAERQFSLAQDQEVGFYGLPVGATYKITEASCAYIASYKIVDQSDEENIVEKASGENTKARTELSTGEWTLLEDEEILVTYTNTPTPVTEITVVKEWDDDDDRDGIRPKSISVQLLADGKPSGIAAVLTRSTGWTYTWTDLDVYNEAGTEIVYTLSEVEVSGQYQSKTGDLTPVKDTDGKTTGYLVKITNKHEPELTEIPVTKKWEDNNDKLGIRPKSIVLNLLADGIKIGSETVEPDENGDWSYTFTKLPKFRDQGTEIEYTVTEEELRDYVLKQPETQEPGANATDPENTGAAGNSEDTGNTTTGITLTNKLKEYEIQLVKVDQDDKTTALKGARFALYPEEYLKEDGSVNPNVTSLGTFTTDADSDGKAVPVSLGKHALGTYYLVERRAPTSYMRLLNPIKLVLSGEGVTAELEGAGEATAVADKEKLTVTITVTNLKGSNLPGVGGSGTEIYYLVGFGIMLAAGTALLMNRRKQEAWRTGRGAQ